MDQFLHNKNNTNPSSNCAFAQINKKDIDFYSDFNRLLEREQNASNFHFNTEQINEFKNECSNIKRDYEKFDAVLLKFIKSDNNRICFVEAFNNYIGFSIPSENVISIIYDTYVNHQKIYPNAKLVDLGTGSGIYPWLLKRKGIDKDKLVAVDLPLGENLQKFNSIYWDNITRDKSYTPHADDMVFISWGYGRYHSLDRYLLSGGKCVVIIGELFGCTFHVNFFAIDWDMFNESNDNIEDISNMQNVFKNLRLTSGADMTGNIPSDDLKFVVKGWNTKIYQIDTVNLSSQDYLSINIKY